MKNFPSPHVHTQSLDTASTIENFAKRETELGTGYLTSTDHGTLQATRTVYDLCTTGKFKGKLKPILGIEGYFRDDVCPILTSAGVQKSKDGIWDGFKYGHITLHCLDEEAYSALSRAVSDADLRAEWHGSERKPLFTWQHIETLGQYNVTAGSGCLIGAVSRHLMRKDPVSAMKYYERLRSTFKPGNWYAEVFPHVCDRNWESKVEVAEEDGKTSTFRPWKKLKTVVGGDGIKAEDLAAEYKKDPQGTVQKHQSILEVMEARAWTALERPLSFRAITKKEGWVVNDCSPTNPGGDLQFGANQFIMAMARKYGDTVIISDDAHFSRPEEKIVQDVRLGQSGSWRMANSYHRRSSDEAFEYFRDNMGVPQSQFEGWIENGLEWADRFKDFKFSPRQTLPVSFYPQDTLRYTMGLIKKHGRMDWGNQAAVARLDEEIKLLYKNGSIDLLPYFMVVEEALFQYHKAGVLTGPGRGSAAGCRLAYLLGITHNDPLKYDLSLDRFLTLDRIQTKKMPDIDNDLSSRAILVGPEDKGGWLKERFGDCAAQISVVTTFKLKNSIKDVFRAFDRQSGNPEPRVPQEIEAVCKALPDAPQGVSDKEYVFGYKDDSGAWIPGLTETNQILQNFISKYPKEWGAVQLLLGLGKNASRHACGYLIANEPIQNFIPLMTVGEVRVTSFGAAGVEAAGGLKIDFLNINSLKDIEGAIKNIRAVYAQEELAKDEYGVSYAMVDDKKVPAVRLIPFGEKQYDVWDLPDDVEVYKDICQGRVETVFQFDAGAARQGLRHFATEDGSPSLRSINDLAAFTALDRPGPLDATVTDETGNSHNMLVEFARRSQGMKPVGAVPVLDKMLPETKGVIIYQEQCQRIFQDLGHTTAIQANEFRYRFSKKKMVDVDKIDRPIFLAGATPALGEQTARTIWDMLFAFAGYSFNRSHAVSYVTTSYACAWLKHHYPLEWWTAVLTNAKRNEIDEKFWRYCGHLIDLPDVSLSKAGFDIQNERIRAPLSLLHGLGEKAHQQLLAGAPYSSLKDLLERIEQWKIDHPRMVNKKDKKTGEKKMVPAKGVSAISSTVIQNLIVSGAMDSLFPATDESGCPMTVQQRLVQFIFTAREVCGGKKKIDSFATRYDLESPLTQLQLRKKILPAYSARLLPLVKKAMPYRIKGNHLLTFVEEGNRINPDNSVTHWVGDVREEWRIVTGKQFEQLGGLGPMEGELNVAMIAYVVTERKFDYKQRATGEPKTACELTLDVDGLRVPVVKWPSKDGLPSVFDSNLTGSIVACLFNRGRGSKDFFLCDVMMLQQPLNTKADKEESA